MPAGPFIVLNGVIEKIVTGEIDLANDTIRAALLTEDYSPDEENDVLWSDVAEHETSGTGYTPGEGALVSPFTITRDMDTVYVDGEDVAWPASEIEAKYIALVRSSGGDTIVGADSLIGYMDLETDGGSLSSFSSDFTVQWAEDGIFAIYRALS